MRPSIHTSKRLNRLSIGNRIGRILHRARINKGYSLNDLHRITRIGLANLQAIDSGDFKKIPEGFYLRAFIKNYANVVGINGTELLRRFNNELPDPQDPRYMDEVSKNKLLVSAIKQRGQNRRSTVREYVPVLISALIILIVLTGIWIVASRGHSGFTSYHDRHSISMSGETLKKRRVRHHRSHKASLLIKEATQPDHRLIYHVITRVRPRYLTLSSPVQAKAAVGSSNKNDSHLLLTPNRKKLIKLPKRDTIIRLDLSRQGKVRMRIYHRIRSLNSKRSSRSIVLKFSK